MEADDVQRSTLRPPTSSAPSSTSSLAVPSSSTAKQHIAYVPQVAAPRDGVGSRSVSLVDEMKEEQEMRKSRSPSEEWCGLNG